MSKVLKADLRWFSRDLWAQCTSMLMLDLFSDGWMQLVSILRRIPRRCIHLFPLPLLVLRILRTTTTDIGSAIFSHHRNPHSLFLPHSYPAGFADPSRESDEHRINLPDNVHPILPPNWLTRITESLDGRASLHTTSLRGCEEGER